MAKNKGNNGSTQEAERLEAERLAAEAKAKADAEAAEKDEDEKEGEEKSEDKKEESEGDDEAVGKKIKPKRVGTKITWWVPGFKPEANPVLDVSKCNASVRDQAMYHGFAAKGTDAAAFKKGASLIEKAAAIKRQCASLEAGEWNPGKMEDMGDGLLMEAMNKVKPGKFVDLAAYHGWVKRNAELQKLTIAKFIAKMEQNPQVKPLLAEMREAALADVKFDSDSLLDAA